MSRKIRRLLGPWVVVTPDEPLRQTASGIYLPEGNADERFGYATGVVNAVGPGEEKYVKNKGIIHKHSGLKVGDKIMFRGFLQDANRLNGIYDLNDKQCVLHQQDALGVIED
jgi:co-chaperonin GroES (HSP10)